MDYFSDCCIVLETMTPPPNYRAALDAGRARCFVQVSLLTIDTGEVVE